MKVGFFINVPIGFVAASLAPKLLAESHGMLASRRLDLPGAVSVTAGLMLLVYALTSVANGDLSLQTVVLFGLSALALGGFVGIEYRSKTPLLPLGFLRRGTVLSANAIALLSFGAASGMIFMLTIYLQQLQGYSAFSAGLAFVPPALIFFVVGGFFAARLVNRVGVKRVLVASMALQTFGILLLTRISLGANYFTTILPSFIVFALGGALGFTAINIAGLTAAKPGEEGLASGLINTSAQMGGPIGLAMVVTVIGLATQGLGGGVASASTLISGFKYAFGGATVLSGAAALVALRIRDPKNTQVHIPDGFDESRPESGDPRAMDQTAVRSDS